MEYLVNNLGNVHQQRMFLPEPPKEPKIAVIRTSDRMSFRTCRRRWGIESHLKKNMEPDQRASPLWFGTGIHFALEDFSGHRQYKKASEAFTDYVFATERYYTPDRLPDDYLYWAEVGVKMVDYYTDMWLANRDPLRTYVVDGVPQVEVNFQIELPFDLKSRGWDKWWSKVIYSGTIDRIVIDEDGHLWLLDYKTAAQVKTTHITNDSQISAYVWAASHIYDRPVMGMIYQQHLKYDIKPLQPLVSGKLSANKQQIASVPLYKEAIDRIYGELDRAPLDVINFYHNLLLEESVNYDRFVRRDRIFKNAASIEAEGAKIMLELEDMINPALPLYPNPHFMICRNMCPLYEVCVSMDDGADWEDQLNSTWRIKEGRDDVSWKKYLKGPEGFSVVAKETVPENQFPV